MKTFLTVVGSGTVGMVAGFLAALFFRALSQMSAEEDARREYLNGDPWDVMFDDYDKYTDDNLTN